MRRIVTADIGGTHARFAIASIDGGRVVDLEEPMTLRTADHASFQLAWQDVERRAGIGLPDELAVAFAGPVGGDVMKLTNNPWMIRPYVLKERLGVERFTIVNDFGAVGHAVATLGDEHFRHVCGPDHALPDEGVVSIVGPGTGLGVGALIRKAISQGYCDAVTMARPLIANNDLPQILKKGQDQPDRPCTFCNRCLINAVANPLGCYDIRRFDGDHDKMVEQIMTVYRPATFS